MSEDIRSMTINNQKVEDKALGVTLHFHNPGPKFHYNYLTVTSPHLPFGNTTFIFNRDGSFDGFGTAVGGGQCSTPPEESGKKT